MHPRELDELADILLARSYHVRREDEPPFVLASGKQSRHYFECQRTTSYGPALPLIGAAFYRHLLPTAQCVGGLTRGADPVADAIAYYAAVRRERPVHTFSVRKALKDHGTLKWIEGSATAGDRVALVDDVVTSGGSVIQAAQRCRLEELQIVQVMVLVDREEGGMEAIQKEVGAGVSVRALFTYSQLHELYAASHDREPASREHRDLARAL